MHSEEPLVSVLIPAFNRVDLIEETVQSVWAQTYSRVELIVVDDGSTDGTYEKLQQLSDQGNLTLLTHQGRANKGQSAALNLALRHASGRYISILDSDDLFLPQKLEKQVHYLENHPDVGLVYGLGEAVDSQGNWLYDLLSADHTEPNDPAAVLLDCYFLLPQNALVRKQVFDQAGLFEESFRAAQDHDMLIRLAELTRFGFMPEKFFQYRRHDDSISATGAERRWTTGFEILQRAASRYPYKKSIIRRRKAVLNFRLSQVYWQQKNHIKALLCVLKSGLLDPRRGLRVLLGMEKVS
ncbi:MAG: glycosyltransferase [Halomonadaceae bacterium]|nr:MAG: glycosyltransferase [Halomonadaceae bacterium]